ncbi:MAG: cytochrome c [Verrucomicrobiaceae bacterium]|nr:cytochrome c [Verrucomicrobiaceae bacterium]
MKIKHLVIGCSVLLSAHSAMAQQKPEDVIRNRQATFNVIAANVGRIKANLDGDYKKDQVVKAAAVIQAIANAGLNSLFVAGTDKGVGYHESQAKAELFDPANSKKVDEVVDNFNEQANQLALLTTIGDKAAVQAQFGKFRATCKACHDSFRVDSTAATPAPAPAK